LVLLILFTGDSPMCPSIEFTASSLDVRVGILFYKVKKG
jgi:hypothetical protein